MYQERASINPSDRALIDSVGRNIRQARMDMKLNLSEVARILDYPKSKLSEIECGKKIPNAIILSRLADLYGVSAGYFFSGKETNLGEEKYYDVQRMVIPIREEMNREFTRAIVDLCATAFPTDDRIEAFLLEGEEFVKQARHMIDLNYEDCWQEMRGGTNFVIKLGHLESKVRTAREAYNLHRRALKEVNNRNIDKG